MGSDKVFELKKEGNVGVVTIDVPGQPMNTWTEGAIKAFFSLLEETGERRRSEGTRVHFSEAREFSCGCRFELAE
jgi:hypothetical protein